MSVSIVAHGIDRGDRAVRRQLRHLNTPAGEQCVETDERRIGALARKGREGCLDLADAAGIEDTGPQCAHKPTLADNNQTITSSARARSIAATGLLGG